MPDLPKPPKPSEKPELYSVVVHDMGVQDLLFALARDAKVNVSVHPGISGTVTLSVLDQTLPEILDAISSQVDMRYELNGKNLLITPDTPFLKMYRVSYPNISRKSESTVSISTNIASTGASGGGGGSNASSSTITNTANNLFWDTLIANLRDLLRETDKVIPENQAAAPAPAVTTVTPVPAATTTTAQTKPTTGSGNGAHNKNTPTTTTQQTIAQPSVVLTQQSAPTAQPVTYREAASIIANPENGIINVRATQRQHEKVREFLDGIMENARRQVLIEATIVEVDLSDRYQQGIDW